MTDSLRRAKNVVVSFNQTTLQFRNLRFRLQKVVLRCYRLLKAVPYSVTFEYQNAESENWI